MSLAVFSTQEALEGKGGLAEVPIWGHICRVRTEYGYCGRALLTRRSPAAVELLWADWQGCF